MLPLIKHLTHKIRFMSIDLFAMLNASEGMFSEETSPKERRTRQTITHPDFPEIKNQMDKVNHRMVELQRRSLHKSSARR